MKTPTEIARVVNCLMQDDAVKRATFFGSPTFTVKATRTLPPRKREQKAESYLVTVGRPNFAERAFITSCRRAGEAFPIKKVLLQFYPKKRKV